MEDWAMVTSETITEALRDVMDPEVQMNVVDLGLIKEITVAEDRVSVQMVLTMPGCPLARYLVSQVHARVRDVAEGRQVDVRLLDEPWTPPWAMKPDRP
jgi:serine O-acetyltransferase